MVYQPNTVGSLPHAADLSQVWLPQCHSVAQGAARSKEQALPKLLPVKGEIGLAPKGQIRI